MARYLSTSNAFPFVHDDTRSALQEYAHRIERAESGLGQIALQGPSEELRGNDHVRRAYLGG